MKTTKLPSAPPLEVDIVPLVTLGTALWFVGFVVLLPFHAAMARHGRGDWQWICLAGGALGLVGVWYCRARRAAIRRGAAAAPEATA